MYRDGKQQFALGTSLAHNRGAFVTATVMSMTALMLHRGLAAHTAAAEEHASDPDRRAPPSQEDVPCHRARR